MAATNHTLTFENGIANDVSLPVGTYTYVSNTIPGYSNGGTVSSFTVTKDTTALALQIEADGRLTINVIDDLNQPIQSGELQLSDSAGTTKIGAAVGIANGQAEFTNLPYDANGIGIFVSQNSSDDDHEPITTLHAKVREQKEETDTILNQRKTSTFDAILTDKYYAGLTSITGEVVVNG